MTKSLSKLTLRSAAAAAFANFLLTVAASNRQYMSRRDSTFCSRPVGSCSRKTSSRSLERDSPIRHSSVAHTASLRQLSSHILYK